MGRARFVFSVGVQLSVLLALLTLVFFVMPGHSGLHLFKINILPVDDNLSHSSSILICLVIFDGHVFIEDKVRKIVL